MAEKTKTEEKRKTKDGLLVSKAVRVILSNKRRATSKTKKRGEVSGGGKKPFRQKGTGRARAGSNRSPIWRGGGITFGPTGEQSYKLSMNKKEMQAAKKEAYAAKKSDIVEVSGTGISKTKEAAEVLKKNKVSGKVLVLAGDLSLKRYFRNIKDVQFILEGNENVYDILQAQKIVRVKGKVAKKEAETKEVKA